MKIIILSFLLSISNYVLAKVPLPIMDLYIPDGITQVDQAKLLATVSRPNLCFHSKVTPEVTRRGNDIYIYLGAKSDHQLSCAQVMLNEFVEINLGVLKEGFYQLHFNNGTPYAIERDLKIDSHPGTRAFLSISETSLSNDKVLTIKGMLEGDCAITPIEEILLSNDKSLTLNIINQEEKEVCPKKPVEYIHEIDLNLFGIERDFYVYVPTNNGIPFTKLLNNSHPSP